MEIARKNLNWEDIIKKSIDPDLAREILYRNDNSTDDEEGGMQYVWRIL